MDYAALVEMFVSARRLARFEAVAAARLTCMTMVFDQINDPHNQNACIRVADSFGLQQVHHLGDALYLPNSKISKTSDQWVDVANWKSAQVMSDALRDQGYMLAGSVVPDPGAHSYHDLALPPRLALVMGSELRGLSPAMQEQCDILITIPTHGFVDSLNLSTAAAILAEHFSTRYRRSGKPVTLERDARAALVARWIDMDLRSKLYKRGLSMDDMLARPCSPAGRLP